MRLPPQNARWLFPRRGHGPGRSWTRRAFVAGLLLAASLALGGLAVVSAQEIELEYKLKAAFLYNFLKFTQWPADKYSPAEPAMLVGCLADDLAAPQFARALEGKKINGLPIKFVALQDGDDPRNCHLLFISRNRKAQIDETLARLKHAPVLTVSETDQFAQRGGMINFVRHERTFRFEINLEAAERAHLRISSDLSSMATVVKSQSLK